MTVTRLAQPNQTWIVIVHENVTIRRQAEELRRLAWKQSAAIAAKRQMTVAMRGFVNEVAHEVNTPLTALKLHLHPVLRGIPPETSGAVRHAMERLERSAQRIGAIGWAISKHPRLSVVDSTTLENPLEGVRPEAERRSIRLESDLASGLLLADPVLLGECLACLATACISNCPSGGFVRYEADAEAQRFVLTLRGATGAESSEADLWILAARQLAKISGFQLREERTSPSEQSYTVEVPLAQPRPRNEGVAGFTAEAR
jgi:phosphoglycerate-specific signal transduction histidine kinase